MKIKRNYENFDNTPIATDSIGCSYCFTIKNSQIFKGIGKTIEKIRREVMKQVNFKGLNPDDLHTCQHCQHSFHDTGMNRKVCAMSGQPIEPMDYIQVNDCEEYKSPYLSDYRRRTDLENELKTKEL